MSIVTTSSKLPRIIFTPKIHPFPCLEYPCSKFTLARVRASVMLYIVLSLYVQYLNVARFFSFSGRTSYILNFYVPYLSTTYLFSLPINLNQVLNFYMLYRLITQKDKMRILKLLCLVFGSAITIRVTIAKNSKLLCIISAPFPK